MEYFILKKLSIKDSLPFAFFSQMRDFFSIRLIVTLKFFSSTFQGSTDWESKTDDELLAEFALEESNSFNKVPLKHDVCWDLEKRGGVGETPTHLLHLMDSAEHSEVAKILLNMFPKLALDYYETDEYYGKITLFIFLLNSSFQHFPRDFANIYE